MVGDFCKNYQQLIPDLLEAGISVTIYAGDLDYICNYKGNKAWTLKLDWSGKEQFNAAHRLHNPEWSEEQNVEVFGKCNNPNWHGHNYELIVKLTGEKDYEIEWDLAKQVIREMKGIPVLIGRLDNSTAEPDSTAEEAMQVTDSGISLQLETGISE